MHSIPASFSTLQKIFLGIGAVGLAVSCLMTAKFGYSMSALHAIALCTVTVCAAFIFPARTFLKNAGATGAARMIAILGCFFITLEFFSDLGYTIGMRDKSMQEASVDTVAYKNVQDALTSQRSNLGIWAQQLADLKAAKPWLPTVTANGLRGQLAIAEKAIADETARGGCGRKCNDRMKEKADLEDRIAAAEQVDTLNGKIEAAQRLVASSTDTAVGTKMGFSPVKAQTDFVAQLWNIGSGVDADKALNPDAIQLTVTQILIGFFIALGATFLPTTAFYIGFFGLKGVEPEAQTESVWDRQAKRNAETRAREAQDGGTLLHNEDHATYVKLEGDRADDIRRLLANIKNALPRPAEAI